MMIYHLKIVIGFNLNNRYIMREISRNMKRSMRVIYFKKTS